MTFCAGALANAATLDVTNTVQDAPVHQVNVQNLQQVPAPAPQAAPTPVQEKTEIVQPIPNADADEDFDSLSDAVAAQDAPASLDRELNCLAVSIYYEAKGEPLSGQLAVADVILNRTESGRFPTSVCGVVTQRGQFSFVRGGKLPTPPSNGQWKKALAVAQVAMKDQWDSPVPEALYFHARYVKPSWKRARVGSVGNHVFYR
ncbi:spore germination cell wall hydrolase CwlJ-like protein [Sphingomonas kyeonggiensis]|uniref:Spore germination cell wall hydrolase CwlJ-like protein n=1 Tax=Sphingomonas kyeonggiensis TaxID=1268553 RepID=A0A7W7JZG4_9SPHN|nr:cell wall hydrolase [Sphingomonas kyeonggiensis]MBB4837951.1 spore germination cell wall hydrolase CwlJ-like protein [Sphingomonas kyeonggiensis]